MRLSCSQAEGMHPPLYDLGLYLPNAAMIPQIASLMAWTLSAQLQTSPYPPLSTRAFVYLSVANSCICAINHGPYIPLMVYLQRARYL